MSKRGERKISSTEKALRPSHLSMDSRFEAVLIQFSGKMVSSLVTSIFICFVSSFKEARDDFFGRARTNSCIFYGVLSTDPYLHRAVRWYNILGVFKQNPLYEP